MARKSPHGGRANFEGPFVSLRLLKKIEVWSGVKYIIKSSKPLEKSSPLKRVHGKNDRSLWPCARGSGADQPKHVEITP